MSNSARLDPHISVTGSSDELVEVTYSLTSRSDPGMLFDYFRIAGPAPSVITEILLHLTEVHELSTTATRGVYNTFDKLADMQKKFSDGLIARVSDERSRRETERYSKKRKLAAVYETDLEPRTPAPSPVTPMAPPNSPVRSSPPEELFDNSLPDVPDSPLCSQKNADGTYRLSSDNSENTIQDDSPILIRHSSEKLDAAWNWRKKVALSLSNDSRWLNPSVISEMVPYMLTDSDSADLTEDDVRARLKALDKELSASSTRNLLGFRFINTDDAIVRLFDLQCSYGPIPPPRGPTESNFMAKFNQPPAEKVKIMNGMPKRIPDRSTKSTSARKAITPNTIQKPLPPRKRLAQRTLVLDTESQLGEDTSYQEAIDDFSDDEANN